ncbi:phosphotransferase family protein [Kribbella deserti]|uniref:Phosphotransferase family protein n=1 Tax=Kribbella deserti TaxID=1926257 RepID=A0ABV6QL66_9ACTN
MNQPPAVDYAATSARPGWNELPAELQQALVVALGTEIAEAGPSVGSGFTGGFAAPLRLADGREVFVKAAADDMHAYGAYQREAELVPALPRAIAIPPIVATAHATSDGKAWFAVAAKRIHGRLPGTPWTETDFARVTASCEVMATSLTPSPVPGLESLVQDIESGGLPVAEFARLRDTGEDVPDGFQPWLPHRLDELVKLIELYPEALAGTSAMHGDLRPDNLLVDESGTCWTVDWNWLGLGPAWADWVGLLPVAHHHGIDTASTVANSPLTADVPPEHLDCWVAAVASYMLTALHEPPPPGCTPELRRHQRLMGWTFLEWLAIRRGW